jgi:chromosome segregation ATPase
MSDAAKDILTFLAAVGAGVLYPMFRDWIQRKSKQKQESEIDLDVSQAAQKIAEGSATIAQAMEAIVKPMIQRIGDAEKEIAELKERKAERELQIRSLDYDMAQLRSQVASWEEKYRQLESKYANSRKAIEILIQGLQDALIPLPSGLEMLLGDSINKFKKP